LQLELGKKKKREKKSTVALRNDKRGISQGDIFVWRKIVSACLTTNHFRGILGKRIWRGEKKQCFDQV